MKTNVKAALKPSHSCHPEGSVATRDLCPTSSDKDPSSRQRLGRDDNGANDRLSAAKKLCDELNDSRLWKIKISYQKRWTHLKRTRQSVKFQGLKPWRHSTGPKTAAGKNRAARNRHRGCPVKIALDCNARFLRLLNRYITLRKKAPALAQTMLQHLQIAAITATAGLHAAIRFSSQETP